jgi:Tol biopolymer transport system component
MTSLPRARVFGLLLLVTAAGAACDSGSATNAATGTHTVSVSVTSPVGAGELFKFTLGSSTSVAITQSATPVAFPDPLADGAAYTVSQTDGPRSCTASANRSGTIAGADVVVTMDCGAAAGSTALRGTLHAPVGSVVVLQENGGSDLSLTMPPFPNSMDDYNLLEFAFPTKRADGTAYQLSVKTPPPGQVCAVYKGATGTLPVAMGAVRVGCEWTYDHVSRNNDDTAFGTFFDSSAVVIGGNAGAPGVDGYGEGRFVAFVSSAAGLGASGAKRQIFWRDRLTGGTLLVSHDQNVKEGNDDSFAPSISDDGLWVAYESYATNLVANDTNAVRDVFLWSARDQYAAPKRVSVGPAGVEADGDSIEASISGDGKVIAFSSRASNLAPGVSGVSTFNVYRRDLVTGVNTLVSTDAANIGQGGAHPALSLDGKRLAFYSFSDSIVTGDANALWDIFVYDHPTVTTKRVSLTSTGAERNQGNESSSRVVSPGISGDGRYVAYATTATNVVPGDTNDAQDVFVVDTQTNAVQRVSIATGGAEGNADSPIGQGERPALSRDGKWVAFSTQATNLGVGVGNVVMHDRVGGETRVVSTQTGSTVTAPSISATGAYVAFGAGNPLDARFPSSGMFARFTGAGRAWWWFE